MVFRLSPPNMQFANSLGVPLAGGKLFFYASGTSTLQNTFSDAAVSIANPNPIILDSGGYARDIFLSQGLNYKVVLTDANGVTIWTVDPVSDPTSSGQSITSFLAITGAASTTRSLLFQTAGGNRFGFVVSSTAESGANSGSDLTLVSYDDTGAQLQNVFSVTRTTGVLTFIKNPILSQPTITKLLSGSGTYTTPTGAVRLRIRMVGASGGGGGTGTTTTGGNAGNGGATSFGTITAIAGSGGKANATDVGGDGGVGGTAGVGSVTLRIGGQAGSNGAANIQLGSGQAATLGGVGGASPFGGAGAPSNLNAATHINAATNSGSGAAGATSGAQNVGSAGGGGAGEYVEFTITSPAATYSYAVGAAGAAGAAGTSGVAGGAGSAGAIYIEEFYY